MHKSIDQNLDSGGRDTLGVLTFLHLGYLIGVPAISALVLVALQNGYVLPLGAAKGVSLFLVILSSMLAVYDLLVKSVGVGGSWINSFVRLVVALGIMLIYTTAAISPLMAWDALSHWGLTGHNIATALATEVPVSIDLFDHRHPPLIPTIYALFSAAPVSLFSIEWPSLFWIVCTQAIAHFLSCLLVIPMRYRLFSVLVVLQVPYVYNQLVHWGYTELPILAYLIAAAYLLSTAKKLTVSACLTALGLLLCASFFKNVAPLLALSILVAFCVARLSIFSWGAEWFKVKFPNRLLIRCFPILIALCAISSIAWATWLHMGVELKLFGKSLILIAPEQSSVAKALASIFLEKISYPLLLPICLLGVWSWVTCRNEAHATRNYFLLHIACFLTVLIFASWFTEYGFSRASPDRDTGGTRHLFFPVFFWYVFCVASVSSKLKLP